MCKDSKKSKKERYQENRAKLKALSNEVEAAVQEGEFATKNEAILARYMAEDPEITEFRKFWDWVNDGYTVVSGAKGYVIWGQLVKRKEEEQQGEKQAEAQDTEEDKQDYWPLCYLFANTQVRKKEEKTDKKQKKDMPPQRGEARSEGVDLGALLA